MITSVTEPHRHSGEPSRRDARLAVVAPPVTSLGWILAAVVLRTLPWQLIGVGLFFLGLWLSARTNRRRQQRGLRWLPPAPAGAGQRSWLVHGCRHDGVRRFDARVAHRPGGARATDVLRVTYNHRTSPSPSAAREPSVCLALPGDGPAGAAQCNGRVARASAAASPRDAVFGHGLPNSLRGLRGSGPSPASRPSSRGHRGLIRSFPAVGLQVEMPVVACGLERLQDVPTSAGTGTVIRLRVAQHAAAGRAEAAPVRRRCPHHAGPLLGPAPAPGPPDDPSATRSGHRHQVRPSDCPLGRSDRQPTDLACAALALRGSPASPACASISGGRSPAGRSQAARQAPRGHRGHVEHELHHRRRPSVNRYPSGPPPAAL